tara:strand:- start:4203 stop:4433 length:231 start_codon:yes stop_codon:yes gene_type:complete
LAVPFIIAIKDSANWNVFLWRLLSCAVFLAVYSLNVFDLFGEEWKRIINKKFKKKEGGFNFSVVRRGSNPELSLLT